MPNVSEYEAEVNTDAQGEPIVRIRHGATVVTVHLADATGVVETPEGRYGLEVTGPWFSFVRACSVYFSSLVK